MMEDILGAVLGISLFVVMGWSWWLDYKLELARIEHGIVDEDEDE